MRIPRTGDSNSTADGKESCTRPRPVLVRFDGFELDEANARLTRDGQKVAVAPTPFAVLCALVRRSGALLTKQALLDEVWGHRFISESVLKTAISEIRAVLCEDARKPRYIETVSRRGYRFIATATEIAATAITAGAPASDGRASPARSFIGRADALSRLREAWDLACRGKPRLVWIAGDAGVGKTALIEHFVSQLGDVACAFGQCIEQRGGGEPHLAVLEALNDLSRRDRLVAPLLREVAPTWLLRLPWLASAKERDAVRRELAGTGAERMLREIAIFFDRHAEHRPLLLVTEDLHWSGCAMIELMDHVARRRSTARFMWLASFRLAEVGAHEHPLERVRRALSLHGLCEEIMLDPFSEREVADCVRQRAPSLGADEAFVRVLHQRTGGRPLFVAHVMDDIVRSDAAGDSRRAAARLAKVRVSDDAAGLDRSAARLAADPRALLDAAFMRRALAEAREQEAPSLVLMALLALCRHVDPSARDSRPLAAIVDRRPEAVGTNAVMKARALLAKTRRHRLARRSGDGGVYAPAASGRSGVVLRWTPGVTSAQRRHR